MAGAKRSKGERADFSGFVALALATLRAEPPSGPNWLHEIKFDGYRIQAHLRQGIVALLTRSGLDWTGYVRSCGSAGPPSGN
jgi:bifunctional non-homologous end joining protein LigD